jgi:hypothetical protein
VETNSKVVEQVLVMQPFTVVRVKPQICQHIPYNRRFSIEETLSEISIKYCQNLEKELINNQKGK